MALDMEQLRKNIAGAPPMPEDKGKEAKPEGEEPDWKQLCKDLLKAVADINKQVDELVDEDISDEEAIAAIEELTKGGNKPAEQSPWDRMQGRGDKEEAPRPKKSGGFAKTADRFRGKPMDNEPEEDDEEDDDNEFVQKGRGKRF